MKNIITTSFCFLLIFFACMPDDKSESELPRDQKPQREYKQATFEVKERALITSTADIKAISPSIVVLGQRMGYNLTYQKLIKNKDTLYFDTIFFATKDRDKVKNSSKEIIQGKIIEKPSPYDNLGAIPWGRHFLSKQQDNCFKIIISQFSNCKLPAFIDSIERKKNWCVIFPYQIKGKEKCLIVYELDSVFSKKAEGQIYDPIIEPFFKTDSLYHFP